MRAYLFSLLDVHVDLDPSSTSPFPELVDFKSGSFQPTLDGTPTFLAGPKELPDAIFIPMLTVFC